MKGTAVLKKNNYDIVVLESVDRKTYNEIIKQCGCEHCNCSLNEKVVDLGHVMTVGYKEDEIDWDYGY